MSVSLCASVVGNESVEEAAVGEITDGNVRGSVACGCVEIVVDGDIIVVAVTFD